MDFKNFGKKPYGGFLFLYQCLHIRYCNWGSQEDLKTLITQSMKVNSLLNRDPANSQPKKYDDINAFVISNFWEGMYVLYARLQIKIW